MAMGRSWIGLKEACWVVYGERWCALASEAVGCGRGSSHEAMILQTWMFKLDRTWSGGSRKPWMPSQQVSTTALRREKKDYRSHVH